MSIDSNVELYFEASGPRTAPTIVFLHGGGVAGWMWRKVVKALSPTYHCLTPDLPEQGQTTGGGAFTIESAADRVAGLIRSQAHGGKAVVVGLSEGAQVAVALLSRAPQTAERAMISSAVLLPLPFSGIYTRGVMKATQRWFMQPFNQNDGWIRLNMKYATGIPEEYFSEFKRSFQQTTADGFANLMVSNLNFRMPAGLEKADLPVLVMVGSKEYPQMKQSARNLLAVLPRAVGRMVNLGPKSSLAMEHNWAVTAPDLFSATLRAFIEDRPLPEELVGLGE